MGRMGIVGLLAIILLVGALEYYSYSAIRFGLKSVRSPLKNYLMIAYIVITVAWFATLFSIPLIRTAEIPKGLRNFLIAFSMGFLLMKLMIAIILLIDDVRRLVFYIISKFYSEESIPSGIENGITRSEFLSKMALLLGGTLFGGLIYGMTNRYNYKIKNIKLSFSHLPASFKGLRIIQISDIHSGSLSNKEAVIKGIEMINAQKPDLILFTGDLVNNDSKEALDFIPIFNKLIAPLGVFSILGNHDYGDYKEWDSARDKVDNLNLIKSIQKDMGWNLLLNETAIIEKNGEKIALIGVENTSFKNKFKTYGNMPKAYEQAKDIPFKMLMSHDPSHWDGEINSKYKDVALTMSGHTHGFQFGIEIPWLKWSPSQYIYKQWAGLYQHDEQYLYVNRGFGFLGYPGRVGIMPEITCIDLV